MDIENDRRIIENLSLSEKMTYRPPLAVPHLEQHHFFKELREVRKKTLKGSKPVGQWVTILDLTTSPSSC